MGFLHPSFSFGGPFQAFGVEVTAGRHVASRVTQKRRGSGALCPSSTLPKVQRPQSSALSAMTVEARVVRHGQVPTLRADISATPHRCHRSELIP